MKITHEYLKKMGDEMAKIKVKPLEVYIAIIGDRKFMIPLSTLPGNLAPLPCEIVNTEFPIEVKISEDTHALRFGFLNKKTRPEKAGRLRRKRTGSTL